MTPDELLCFTVFDSAPPAGEALYGTMPAPTVVHSAFADPHAPPGEPPRQSVDVRCLLIWDAPDAAAVAAEPEPRAA